MVSVYLLVHQNKYLTRFSVYFVVHQNEFVLANNLFWWTLLYYQYLVGQLLVVVDRSGSERLETENITMNLVRGIVCETDSLRQKNSCKFIINKSTIINKSILKLDIPNFCNILSRIVTTVYYVGTCICFERGPLFVLQGPPFIYSFCKDYLIVLWGPPIHVLRTTHLFVIV